MYIRPNYGSGIIHSLPCKIICTILILLCLLFLFLLSQFLLIGGYCSIFSLIHSEKDIIDRYLGYRPTPGDVCEERTLPITAEEFFIKYKNYSKPVIIHVPGGFQTLGWKTHLWSEKYLIQKTGDVMVDVEKKRPKISFGWNSDHATMSFREFLTYIFQNITNLEKNNNYFYLNLQNNENIKRVLIPPLSLLTEDFFVPGFFLLEPTRMLNLWMGKSDTEMGSQSGLHHDGGDNLFALIAGKKNFRLYSPADSYNLYPMGYLQDLDYRGHYEYCGLNPNAHWSQIELSDPEHKKKFPKFSKAIPLDCVVEEGDMVFIPGGWWHQVTSYGVHMGINIWTM